MAISPSISTSPAPRPHILIQTPYPLVKLTHKEIYYFLESTCAILQAGRFSHLGASPIPAVLLTTAQDSEIESCLFPKLAESTAISGIFSIGRGNPKSSLFFPNPIATIQRKTSHAEITDSIRQSRHLLLGASGKTDTHCTVSHWDTPLEGALDTSIYYTRNPVELSALLGSSFGLPQPYFQNMALLLTDGQNFDAIEFGRKAAHNLAMRNTACLTPKEEQLSFL